MGHILPGFKRNSQGGITSQLFDSDSFPSKDDGWYDSPSKVPPLIRLGQVVPDPARPEVRASKSEASISASLQTFSTPHGALSPKQMAAKVKPRVGGRFVKAR